MQSSDHELDGDVSLDELVQAGEKEKQKRQSRSHSKGKIVFMI